MLLLGTKDVLILDSLCEVCLFSSLVSPSLDVGQISSLFPAFQDFCNYVPCCVRARFAVCSPAELGT